MRTRTFSMNLQGNDKTVLERDVNGVTGTTLAWQEVEIVSVSWHQEYRLPEATGVKICVTVRLPDGEQIESSTQACMERIWDCLRDHPVVLEARAEVTRLDAAKATSEEQAKATSNVVREAATARRKEAMSGPWAAWAVETPVPPIGDDPPAPNGARWGISPAQARGEARKRALKTWISQGGVPPWLKE